ncbi:MAG: hypothetical protein EWV40_09290 [Microcystis flos-aquae Mf_WU_F_19750830_S460]|uniref:Uncharacterized protein n=1 Tax=Microcystis flos-aquae Mf_WU_F_19750830_S460 TaxID=2486237 RepID=A0A552LRV8_9CHRO|nr:MAG: hypothetical protein EWV40_09290 [Microcystis flos-aquae Mf_WU_F_19750830_S460]
MYTGLGKLSIQSEKWRSGVVMFLNVKFCYEIQHFCSETFPNSRICSSRRYLSLSRTISCFSFTSSSFNFAAKVAWLSTKVAKVTPSVYFASVILSDKRRMRCLRISSDCQSP